MRLFWATVLHSLIIQGLFAQQPAGLANEWAQDLARVERLKDNHKRLPKSLYEEMKILDSVLNEICEKKIIEPPMRCEHARSKLSYIRNQLNKVGNDIRIAKGELDSVEAALSNLGLAKSREEYDTQRNLHLNPRIKEYEQIFEKIRRGEKRLVRRAIWYAAKNYWSKDPFPTTAVSQYLKQVRKVEERHLKSEIEAVKSEIRIAKQEKAYLLDTILHHEKQIKGLQSRTQWLTDSSQLLYSKVSSLDSVHSNHYANLEKLSYKLALKDEEIKERANELEKLKASRDSMKHDLSHIEKNLLNRIRDNENLNNLNDSLSKLLIDKQNSLTIATKELDDAKYKLDDTKDQNAQNVRGLYIGLIFFLLLALYGQYQKMRIERKGKQKVRSTNAKLATANAELKDKKAELESLINELHHRTKNNLQEISALLYLQAREIDDTNLKNTLNEARGRIDAIGIVHRLLYQDKQQRLTKINLARYVEELTEHLFKTHHFLKENIRTVFSLQDIYIEADRATQVGLITNELVHNCFKHAFPKITRPELAIGLTAEDNMLRLSVKDNGPGLSHETDWKETNSFGLKLVRRLVEGRRGTFCYEEKNGAIFNVTLPLNASEYEIAS